MTDVVVRYRPKGAARELLECRRPEVCASGPAGTGKTMAMLFKIHLACLKVPGVRALLVRQTHASLTGTTLVTFEQQVAVHTLANGTMRWFGGSAREPAAYRYVNGSTILVGGLDRPEKFLSSEFDLVAIDEATEIDETAYETLISRLRGKALTNKQMLLATNPDAPQHWLKVRSDRGAMTMLHSRHEDNPLLYDDDGALTEFGASYMSKLDALTGVRYERLRKGRWCAAEGVIYEEFDPGQHVVDWFMPPDDWMRFWVIDFGYTNPFVWQSWAEDHDGRLWLYREVYMTRKTVDQHAIDIMNAVSTLERPREGAYAHEGRVWHDRKPHAVIGDHDAEGRAVLERELDMPVRAADKAVIDGIQAVQGRLRPAGDGRPRLHLMRDALVRRDPELMDAKFPTCTIEEFPSYVWDTSGTKGIKELPLKMHDHGMDCVRYLCQDRDPMTRPRVRML